MRSNSTPALDEIANEIAELDKRGVTDALKIGGLLVEAKEVAADWKGWLDRRFSWSPRTAQRFMRAHAWYEAQPGEKRQVVVSSLSLFALYKISAKKTSPEIVAAILKLANTQNRVGEKAVRELLKARAVPAVAAPTVAPHLSDLIGKAKALATALAAASVEDRRQVMNCYRATFRKFAGKKSGRGR